MRYMTCCPIASRVGPTNGNARVWNRAAKETRHLLARQVRHRFGPAVAAQAELLLTAIADPLQLADPGDALLSCADGTAWLHILHQARSASTNGDEHP